MIGLAGIGRMIEGLWAALVAIGAPVVGLWPARRGSDWLAMYRWDPPGPHEVISARPFLPPEQVVLPRVLRRLRASVHHAPHFAIPYATDRPIVLTIHDLFPYHDRTLARSAWAGHYYRNAMPLAIRRATVVVGVSPFAARQVAETFSVPLENIRIVEHGVDHKRWNPATAGEVEAARVAHALPDCYLLYVGTAKRHKNLQTLLKAHRREHPPLVVAGPTDDDLREAGLKWQPGRLIPLGRVPDQTLRCIYSGARALVLPSLYEAVGFTALEAMACGVPVVCSDGGGLPDTVGSDALLVPPLDVAAWRDAMSRITDDTELRARLVAAASISVQRRDWSRAARSYLKIYEEVAA